MSRTDCDTYLLKVGTSGCRVVVVMEVAAQPGLALTGPRQRCRKPILAQQHYRSHARAAFWCQACGVV